MSSTETRSSQPPTVLPPCPTWRRTAGIHDYHSTDPVAGTFMRHHTAGDPKAGWTISQFETYDHGTVSLDAPQVEVPDLDREISAAQAREISASLLAGAAALETIETTEA